MSSLLGHQVLLLVGAPLSLGDNHISWSFVPGGYDLESILSLRNEVTLLGEVSGDSGEPRAGREEVLPGSSQPRPARVVTMLVDEVYGLVPMTLVPISALNASDKRPSAPSCNGQISEFLSCPIQLDL